MEINCFNFPPRSNPSLNRYCIAYLMPGVYRRCQHPVAFSSVITKRSWSNSRWNFLTFSLSPLQPQRRAHGQQTICCHVSNAELCGRGQALLAYSCNDSDTEADCWTDNFTMAWVLITLQGMLDQVRYLHWGILSTYVPHWKQMIGKGMKSHMVQARY